MAFVCIARDLFSIYFLIIYCLQEAEQQPWWLCGVPIRLWGEPEFPAVQAGLGCSAMGFVCEGQAEFQGAVFSFFRAGSLMWVTGSLLRLSP